MLVRLRPQVEDLRRAQAGRGLGPNAQRALHALLLEHDLPVLITQGDEIAIVRRDRASSALALGQ